MASDKSLNIEAPLAGVRVLDFTHHVAGPYCTRLLALLGADVVKVERPPAGDPGRMAGPFLGETPHPERSALFLYLNTGKRSAALDLKTTPGQEAALGLARGSDVVLESFSPGVMERLGLGYGSLSDGRPSLVYTSISSFGQTGPYRDYLATDLVAQALGGLVHLTGEPDREPLKFAVRWPELLAGASAFSATIAALYHARAAGEGQHVDISIMETVVPMLLSETVSYAYAGTVAGRTGVSSGPGLFRCKDGYASANYTGAGRPRLAEMVGAPELARPPYASHQGFREHRQKILAIIESWTRTRSKTEVFEEAQRRGITSGYVSGPGDVLASPQLRERGFFVELDHPQAGRATYPGPPFRMPAHRIEPRRAPVYGEHTEEVLREASSGGSGATAPAGAPARRAILEGVRVIEVGTTWAGPFTARLLADLGAEVIKIESPSRVDSFRGDDDPPGPGPFPANVPGARPRNRSPKFNDYNRGKCGMLLDLTKPASQEAFRELVQVGDVVIQNFAPRVAAKLGFDYESLRRVRPDVIQVSFPAFGLEGPYRDLRAFGNNVAELSGWIDRHGYEDGAVQRLPFPAVDPTATMHAAGAIIAALDHRRRTGQGQRIEVSLYESAIGLVGGEIVGFSVNGRERPFHGNAHPGMAPHGCYPAAGDDQWVAIAVRSDDEWRRLCDAAGRADWLAGERFATVEGRLRRREELDALVGAWTRSLDKRTAMELLQGAGVAAGAVLDPADLSDDPHLAERGFFVMVHHPEAGSHPHPGSPWRFSRTPTLADRPAPCLDEHTEHVLGDLLGWLR